jgi:protoporphyrinogen oxidase
MKSIAIIGGGFTGLSAAKRLADAGHHIDIYESAKELGGLAACFELEGVPIERAYHHLFRTDTSIIELINELELGDLLQWHSSSVAIYRDGKIRPFMSPVDLLQFGACSFAGRIRTGLVVLYLKKSKNWKPLASITAMKWMRKYCGDSATNAIWAPLLRGKFAGYADKVSMAWLWARLHVRANSRQPGEGEKLGYIHGGFIRIVNGLADHLRSKGACIHLSTPIQAIHNDGKRPAVTVNNTTKSYDAILFTGSNRSFARLLLESPEYPCYVERLSAIHYLGAICLVFTSSQSLGDHYWVNVNEENAAFLVFIQHTHLIPPSEYGGKHVYYIGAYLPHDHPRFAMPDPQLIAEWHNYLTKLYPAFDPSKVEQSHLFRFKDAQHIAEVGYEAKIPSYKTPLPGVFLSNFSQIFPEDRGTNFAVHEGNSASSLIAEYLRKS